MKRLVQFFNPLAFTPKIWTVFKEGYKFNHFKADFMAGLTVAIVALPLSMALAIASGSTPDKGIITAIIAGFLISFLGGSRYQIGGPTGAFVVIVYHIIESHGYDGLLIATIMAGVLLIIFGLCRFGSIIKYIPFPVITGFTAGIAVIIFSSQIKDLLGLQITKLPGDFIPKWEIYFKKIDTAHLPAIALSLISLALLFLGRHFWPRGPYFLIVVTFGALCVWFFNLPVATIGTEFGIISSSLPAPSLPDFTWSKCITLLPSAFTIAFLAGIESLLSAVIADGMTGARHRSDAELIAQGIANIGSACFAGLPATGAIARTATNIRAGARSPIAGMLHAIFLLLMMLLVAPLAQWLPLASLAAILVIVALNMSEIENFKFIFKAPKSDILILILTFLLTVFVDLTFAISIGIILSSLLFTRRMSELAIIKNINKSLKDDDENQEISKHFGKNIPKNVEIYKIQGPFFFGMTIPMKDLIDRMDQGVEILILRMRDVPMIDASGLARLNDFFLHAEACNVTIILSSVQDKVKKLIQNIEMNHKDNIYFSSDYAEALDIVFNLSLTTKNVS
ncbi:MAG: SulP family inorganic anion transporter [Alphaproteobacteria bacterium]|nr:SulP family inorganic anion transporter [Alphaproteobacteria bacterium]